MPDQIIDAVMARSIHADAVRTHPLAAWVIVRDQIDYPGNLVSRRYITRFRTGEALKRTVLPALTLMDAPVRGFKALRALVR